MAAIPFPLPRPTFAAPHCGIIDFPCQIGQALGPFWFWLQLGFWIVVVLIALGALAKVKEVAGWPGVWGVVTGGLVTWAYLRGRGGKSLLPYVVPEKEASAAAQRPPRTAKRSGTILDGLFKPKAGQSKRTYNHDTNTWE